MKHISSALLLSAVAGLSLGVAPMAHAQTAARFSTVEFKDTTLSDALEMIFQAANNPAHTIDPSASQVPIGSITLQNIQWDSALRTLANQNNFKVSRGADGSYLVEPREPVLQDGMGGNMGSGSGSSDPRFRGGSGSSSGGGPANPFGGSGSGNRPSTRGGVNFEILPSMRANAQTTPRVGGAGGASSTTDKPITIIIVRHIYAGGIAQLFGASTIPTAPFVSPNSGGGGGFGGQGGQQGGFGGQQGGLGVQGIGGGGGFGGQQGGFGGQQGGFGGQQGGFGGQQGGFGGQQGGFGGQQGGFGF